MHLENQARVGTDKTQKDKTNTVTTKEANMIGIYHVVGLPSLLWEQTDIQSVALATAQRSFHFSYENSSNLERKTRKEESPLFFYEERTLCNSLSVSAGKF